MREDKALIAFVGVLSLMIQWGGAYCHSWFVDPIAQLNVVALTNTALEGMQGQFSADVRNAVYDLATSH